MNFIREKNSKDKILITGAGGSIGSGLVLKLLDHGYDNIVLLDHSEYLLFQIAHRLNFQYPYYLADIRDYERLEEIFVLENPNVVFHTAALKHVPMLEDHPTEAIKTNVMGTYHLVKLSHLHGVKKFIFISSDKAIKPTSIMGATKRIGEMICQYFQKQSETIFTSVRFGNVLNSSGSVIPIFKEQIQKGGPVTVTHKDMSRFFMSIDQACELLVKAMEIATPNDDVFFLHLGEPINIYELAKFMILSEGKMPHKDIPIVITGLRPGEKLNEEFHDDDELIHSTNYEGIKKVILNGIPDNFQELVEQLIKEAKNKKEIKKIIKQLIPDYQSTSLKK
ncbi:MAG: polysaccharide biosynthesis protein [Leptospiraceae bacterium]|nr:polysaccharide biosynthesis protein [Leptospiraceae bacterium]MDW7976611.1 polysaccharide biosynthesis protein [Leptospiraceae bacterium]